MTNEHITSQVGVVIGRFQVDEIHAGHMELLRHVQRKHPSMLILLGGKRAPQDRENPMEFAPRAQMMCKVFPQAIILPIWDCETDEQWSINVDDIIKSVFPGRKAILYGGRDSFRKHYAGSFTCREMDFYRTASGTSVRKNVASFPEDDPAFRRGVIFSLMNLQPRIFTTVDIAVIKTTPDITKNNKSIWPIYNKEVLLGRKKDAKLWRFPGGFWDISDPTAEIAARRELLEETSLLALGIKYITSQTIDDWRSRGAEDVSHKTLLFVVTDFKGEPKGGDDLPEVKWFPLNEETLTEVTPEHIPLFKEILNL